ncbi:MAG TPA: TIGR04053 family radical SAM/SPASM domain-containing protein [Candidatus Polarisedimenticolia bacterium]|jgi:radical SAM protein|nr:TIGR04053 family radical SAM/SPASM domain-containing protein [Candidatus Polarisedimenticolia bacterium]
MDPKRSESEEAGGAFAASPLVVIWEVSRACDLACVHCRASAIPDRDPLELSTGEAQAFIRTLRGFGRPVFVLTGGDPLKRPDIGTLVETAVGEGLPTYLSPSGTPLLTYAALRGLRQAGLAGVSISLDGSTPLGHDAFRGVRGSFDWSLEGAAAAAALGLRLQINTTVTRHNLHDLRAIAQLVGGLEARRWTLFLLVPTGRGRSEQQITPAECEAVFEWLYDLSHTAPFRIKTTEGPHYRRVVLQRQAERTGATGATGPASALAASRTVSGGGRFVPGLHDGSGFLFLSARGEIQPSGFLPLTAGNVRSDSPVEMYRNHPLFRALRDPERLGGRCGACEFRRACGGSRARAFAATGDFLSEDPLCGYVPRGGPALLPRSAA